jgi:hypothetical protein
MNFHNKLELLASQTPSSVDNTVVVILAVVLLNIIVNELNEFFIYFIHLHIKTSILTIKLNQIFIFIIILKDL